MQTDMTNIVINEVLKLIVPALITMIVGYAAKTLVPLAKEWLEVHASRQVRDIIERVLTDAVRGAEAERLRAALDGIALDVLDFAMKAAGDALLRYGIALDKAELKAGILAALLRIRDQHFDLGEISDAIHPLPATAETKRALPFDEDFDSPQPQAAPPIDPAAARERARALMWM